MSDVFEIAILLAAFSDIEEVKARGVRVSPAANLLLEIIDESPVAARWSWMDWVDIWTRNHPHGEAAFDLAKKVQSRLEWLRRCAA